MKSLLSKATITRLDFNPAMAQRMIDFAKAAGMIITPTALKTIGVAVAGVFITMAVILALSALAYYVYQVVMEDGNVFNLFFLPDSVFIGDTQITGFTKSIAEMTNFFETRMKENPNEEVAKPEGGTDTGEAEKPGEGDGDAEITSEEVNWDVDSNLQHHVANGSNGKHREGWNKFGLNPDDPNFYSLLLPYLKKVVDEGIKFKEEVVKGGHVYHYIKNFAEKGQEIIAKIFVDNKGNIKTLSDAYINTR